MNDLTPMYQIIMNDLRGRIAASDFDYEQPLCTEKSLCAAYAVSRITAKRAIDELEKAGLIYRKRGVGSFVKSAAEAEAPPVLLQSRSIALMIPFSISRGGIFATIEAASTALAKVGVSLNFHVYSPGPANEEDMLRGLYRNGVGGIIYYPSTGRLPVDALDLFCNDQKPVVIIDKPNPYPRYSSVICDNFSGSYEITSHVLSYGHKNICYLSRYTGEEVSSIRDRYNGYMQALADAGIDAPRFVQVEPFNDEADMDYPMLKHVINTLYHENVTAIICENDEVAFNAHMSCRSLSLRPGEDISLTGFDNIHWATIGSAQITTAEQNFHGIGEEAARIILQQDYRPVHSLIPVKLVPRTSTGPAPSFKRG